MAFSLIKQDPLSFPASQDAPQDDLQNTSYAAQQDSCRRGAFQGEREESLTHDVPLPKHFIPGLCLGLIEHRTRSRKSCGMTLHTWWIPTFRIPPTALCCKITALQLQHRHGGCPRFDCYPGISRLWAHAWSCIICHQSQPPGQISGAVVVWVDSTTPWSIPDTCIPIVH